MGGSWAIKLKKRAEGAVSVVVVVVVVVEGEVVVVVVVNGGAQRRKNYGGTDCHGMASAATAWHLPRRGIGSVDTWIPRCDNDLY